MVWETEKPNLSGYSSINFFIMVDFPDPEGPQRTSGLRLDIFKQRFWNSLAEYFLHKIGKRTASELSDARVSRNLLIPDSG